jgi:hypothetical protein
MSFSIRKNFNFETLQDGSEHYNRNQKIFDQFLIIILYIVLYLNRKFCY